jgi:hypothetical protein
MIGALEGAVFDAQEKSALWLEELSQIRKCDVTTPI